MTNYRSTSPSDSASSNQAASRILAFLETLQPNEPPDFSEHDYSDLAFTAAALAAVLEQIMCPQPREASELSPDFTCSWLDFLAYDEFQHIVLILAAGHRAFATQGCSYGWWPPRGCGCQRPVDEIVKSTRFEVAAHQEHTLGIGS